MLIFLFLLELLNQNVDHSNRDKYAHNVCNKQYSIAKQ
jgi:hypothetical protein